VKSVITRLKNASLDPVQLDSDVAEAAGYKIAHKKNPRFRYIAMSRVVFDTSKQKAWLSVELNGERGSIVRLDKLGQQWTRTSRCGGWYMPQE
jgi:tricorn protease-like protein